MFGRNRGDVVLPVAIAPQSVPMAAAPAPSGAVGVGTWATKAKYKDMKVTGSGRTLYQSDAAGLEGWHFGSGGWKAANGVLAQSSTDTDCRATTGNINWTDYTYTLKARKLSGAEGFLVMFHVRDDNNYLWWNIGGWGNTRSAIEQARDGAKQQVGRAAPQTVETGRWYDIKIEVAGPRIRCYLDDKLITDANDLPGASDVEPLYATASRDLSAGDVIIKVVNVTASDQQLQVDLKGAGKVGKATLEEISGNPPDVNSIAAPEKVGPKKTTLAIKSTTFLHSFPAHSVSVLRVHCSTLSAKHERVQPGRL
jgi:alpha-L-arabinofuranosidase